MNSQDRDGQDDHEPNVFHTSRSAFSHAISDQAIALSPEPSAFSFQLSAFSPEPFAPSETDLRADLSKPGRKLAEGKRTKEIAAALGVTIDTANAHIKNIYSKFAVHGRGAVVSEAIRRGFIRRERSTFGV